MDGEGLASQHSGVDYVIQGEIAQALALRLDTKESAWASRGSIISYGSGVAWELKIPGGAGAAIGRMLAGEGIALTRIQSLRPQAEVVLGANAPGKIREWDLVKHGPVVCTRGSFLAAVGSVDIAPTIARRAGAALFGGAGLILQKISGSGMVFVHGAGDFVVQELKAGETIQVSTGNLAAFSASVDYGIIGVGGCRKMLFGREGLFMTRLSGPGVVYLQTLKRAALQATPSG